MPLEEHIELIQATMNPFDLAASIAETFEPKEVISLDSETINKKCLAMFLKAQKKGYFSYPFTVEAFVLASSLYLAEEVVEGSALGRKVVQKLNEQNSFHIGKVRDLMAFELPDVISQSTGHDSRWLWAVAAGEDYFKKYYIGDLGFRDSSRVYEYFSNLIEFLKSFEANGLDIREGGVFIDPLALFTKKAVETMASANDQYIVPEISLRYSVEDVGHEDVKSLSAMISDFRPSRLFPDSTSSLHVVALEKALKHSGSEYHKLVVKIGNLEASVADLADSDKAHSKEIRKLKEAVSKLERDAKPAPGRAVPAYGGNSTGDNVKKESRCGTVDVLRGQLKTAKDTIKELSKQAEYREQNIADIEARLRQSSRTLDSYRALDKIASYYAGKKIVYVCGTRKKSPYDRMASDLRLLGLQLDLFETSNGGGSVSKAKVPVAEVYIFEVGFGTSHPAYHSVKASAKKRGSVIIFLADRGPTYLREMLKAIQKDYRTSNGRLDKMVQQLT